MSDFSIAKINEKIEKESKFVEVIKNSIGDVIVGQNELIDKILIGVLSKGHLLLEGVPGLAKTLTVNVFARTIETNFQRIQFTPDMLPADLLGTLIFNQKLGKFETRKGPIFSNIILADEINRAPSKVQSALLECMQEKQVTISEDTFFLESPFVVIATQNPLEQEGTYPLPEAQLDRFMMKLKVDYPSKKEEKEILNRAAKTNKVEDVKKTIKTKNIINAQNLIDEIYVDEKVEEYVLDLVFATRQPKNYGLNDLSQLIKIGASPRASINLILAAKAKAFIERRGYVIPEDVRYIGKDVLCHRLSLTYEAEAEELLEEDIVQRLFETIEIP
ncbi:MAG: MoxR family ATPase [bacterium TMED144]|nr:MAG: MoxR family ATPase [bacterium TMED144]|tara:strand:+ start:11931 stop:12926 length:996 start_codon:yes stop_codon:yes gene_type:complete